MMTRKILSGVMASVMSLTLLAACGNGTDTPDTPDAPNIPVMTPVETPAEEPGEPEALELTVEELAEYDGKDGNRAFIAVDGQIYDVTDLPPWAGGEHNDYPAGQDYSEEIKEVAPHGTTPLENLEPIGTIVD